MIRYLCFPAFLLIWEFLSRFKLINPIFFPPFTTIVTTVVDMISSGELWLHLKISLARALSGLFIASLAGVPLGILLGGYAKKLELLLELPLEVLSQLNPFLLFHIIILFMGIGEPPKVTIVAWTCLWPITFSTMTGVSQVNPSLIKSGRAFGLRGLSLITKIVLPASAAQIFAGLRLGLGYSMFMLIAAEMMGASSGLGWLVLNSQENFQLNNMYAGVLVIALAGLVLDGLVWLPLKLWPQLAPREAVNTAGD
ncbi:MAG: ABC transporter permease [Deltaproteobacteria bacterium]|jgi:NitT/TauT family transport system permease protein|nr:ABC transporter permease [Deltaproteobacteria bacterium]